MNKPRFKPKPDKEKEIHLHVVVRTTSKDPDKVAGILTGQLRVQYGQHVNVFKALKKNKPSADKELEPMDWKAGEIHAD